MLYFNGSYWIRATPATIRSILSADVSGPSSSTDNAVARFDGATGKIIQNSGITIDDSNDLNIGAHLIKTTDLAIKQGTSGNLDIKNAADDAHRGIRASTLLAYSSITLQSDASQLNSSDVDDRYAIGQSRDNGVGLVEIFRMQGAADPYFSMGGSQENKFYNSGAVVLGDLPTEDPSVAGQLWNSEGTVKVSSG
jgi:hypothetical protein